MFFFFNLTVFNLFWAHILYKTVSAPILFYFNIAFAPLGSLQFHVNLMSCFSIYVRMGGEVLIEITYICTDLDSIDLSVCPLIQEHRMSSFLFGHFKFLSFIIYVFQCTSVSQPWWHLFAGIQFSQMLLKMELVFILFVMDSHCCGIEMQLIFVCSSYDLQICSVCLLLQPVDLWWILFYIYSYAICDTVLLPPFSFGCLYIPCFLSICSGQTY